VRPSPAGIVAHYRQIAEATLLPVLAYNQPGRIGISMDVDLLSEIADIPGIVGVKECERDMASLQTKIDRLSARISVISGDEDLGLYMLLGGAECGIWATPNLAPWPYVEMYEACRSGDLERARKIHETILDLVSARPRQGENHPGPLKELLSIAGRSVGLARSPLMPMTSGQRANAAAVLKRHAELLRVAA
jgi:4-hydroxy-tetrahydrodipicolinate synthase